jgi:PAS domain S-box-containing protein
MNHEGQAYAESMPTPSLLDQSDWLKVTLSSIGDAIVTADPNGVVTFLNPGAQAITGWAPAEATGQPVEAVFRVIDEFSREPVENPAARASRDGTVVKLTDRCVLIARDGTERATEGSAAPIRDGTGVIKGAVFVFRDCTERQQRQRAMKEALSYAEEIVATLREPFLVLDRSLRVKTANASFYRIFHTSAVETEGRFVYEIGNGQWGIPALRVLLEEAIPSAIAVHDFEVEHNFPAIGRKSMLLNARRFPPDCEHPELILLAIEDVTERRRSEAALSGSELRFRRLFQTAKDGILILEADRGAIIEANPFMCGLLGYEVNDFVGKALWQIGLFEDEDANRAAYEELRANGYIRYDHLPLKTKGGQVVEVEFVSNLYMVGGRQVAQCNIRDITQRSRMERQAKAQTAALADLHRRKDEFLAMLSHELRNPLSPILNALHLLRLQGNENPIQQEARTIVERQVGQLSHLVDDLLEVARFTSGKIRLHPVRLDMNGVVERAVESVRPLINARRHILTVNLPDEPIWLHADPARLEQVVVNLLNNAVKYTDEGGRIWIDARIESPEMVLSVRDTGVGIDLAKFPDVFDLFTQADRSLDRSQGGLGIGLALVQRLVDMHWGSVEVQSDGPGLGSQFTIRLPLPSAPAAEAPAKPTSSTERPAHSGRVLVVDDNIDSTDVLARLLRISGHDVRTAYAGPSAVDAAVSYVPDVVLLDIGLPGLNGYEVARRLRQYPQLKSVKLVAMTGYGLQSDLQLAKEAGFDEHLVKPVDFLKVGELLTRLLPERGPTGEPRREVLIETS